MSRPSGPPRICPTPAPRWEDPPPGRARRLAMAGCVWHRPGGILADCPPPTQWAPPSHAPGGWRREQPAVSEGRGRVLKADANSRISDAKYFLAHSTKHIKMYFSSYLERCPGSLLLLLEICLQSLEYSWRNQSTKNILVLYWIQLVRQKIVDVCGFSVQMCYYVWKMHQKTWHNR